MVWYDNWLSQKSVSAMAMVLFNGKYGSISRRLAIRLISGHVHVTAMLHGGNAL